MAVCLISVVSGEAYERYAEELFASAHEHFQIPLTTVMLEGRPGWPHATMYRYHTVLKHAVDLQGQYLFLCDADMRFEAPIGKEILGKLVATQHPGYVGRGRQHLPYETRKESAACVSSGQTYYAGGFVGGERGAFLALAWQIALQIGRDDRKGIVACWHDESHLNRALNDNPPAVTLSPAYCMPDDDSWYRTWWPEDYPRKLIALDKPDYLRTDRPS